MPFLFIWQFILKNKWVQYALLAAALVAVALVIKAHYISEGKKVGVENQKQVETTNTESQRKADRAETVTSIAQTSKEIDAANARADAAVRSQKQVLDLLAKITAQQQDGERRVAGVKDDDLHSYNVSTLGFRKAGSAPACYTATEERAVAEAITQYPICQSKVDKQADDIKAIRDEVQSVRDAQAKQDVKYRELADYTQVLERDYTSLFNNHPPIYRSPKCAFLWKCGKRHLSVPDPKDLKEIK